MGAASLEGAHSALSTNFFRLWPPHPRRANHTRWLLRSVLGSARRAEVLLLRDVMAALPDDVAGHDPVGSIEDGVTTPLAAVTHSHFPALTCGPRPVERPYEFFGPSIGEGLARGVASFAPPQRRWILPEMALAFAPHTVQVQFVALLFT